MPACLASACETFAARYSLSRALTSGTERRKFFFDFVVDRQFMECAKALRLDHGFVAIVEQLHAPSVGFVAAVERPDAHIDQVVCRFAARRRRIAALAQSANQRKVG